MAQGVDPVVVEGGSAIGRREFQEVCHLAHERFGLDLKPGKEALVSSRLSKRMRECHLQNFGQYLELVREDTTGAELSALIDALTTNYTSFLREPAHFALLRKSVLPQLKGRASLSIWSCGCATGEEPYSILFHLLDEYGMNRLTRLNILATDISRRALEKAAAAIYPKDRFRELPPGWMPQFLQQGTGKWEGYLRVRKELRSRVEYRRLNLMESFSHLPAFPVIFCRNVMIYFDKPTQEKLIQRFTAQLEPGGYLMIGHSEGLMGIQHDLVYIQPAVYRRRGELSRAGTERRERA
jgi:chemotaxis protein methyltransferase CheR